MKKRKNRIKIYVSELVSNKYRITLKVKKEIFRNREKLNFQIKYIDAIPEHYDIEEE